MTPENFVYWLQGYFELNDTAGSGTLRLLREEQLKVIKDHLKLVLEKKTPAWIPPSGLCLNNIIRTDPDPVYYQQTSPSPPAIC